MSPLRIVLADPYDTVRKAVRDWLNHTSDLKVVGTAAKGKETIRLVECLAPDVLILEALIDQPSGLEVVRWVQAAASPTRVLVLSRCVTPWLVHRMFEEGVYGYFAKRDRPDVVLRALHRVAAGEDGLLGETVACELFSRDDLSLTRARRVLTEREWQVMQLVVAEGLSNGEIAKRLFIAPGTAKNHVSHIYEKLGLSSRAKLITWAYRQGLSASALPIYSMRQWSFTRKCNSNHRENVPFGT